MWQASGLDTRWREGRPRASPHSYMRRNLLIILGIVATAALVWGVLAVVLDSPTLTLSSGSSASSTSPECLPRTLERTAALPGADVDVSPAPGSETANARTQISFLGAPAAQIADVSVSGSHSGEHAGDLRSYSQGDGASFSPAEPFALGEHVKVRATIGTGAAAKHVSFEFRVDTPYSTAHTTDFENLPASSADQQSFYTLAGTRAPVMTVTTPDRDPGAGD